MKQFEETGCPQKEWNGKEGCPAWKELVISSRGNPLNKEIKKQCLDLWEFEFHWASMGQREGLQQAMESNRNMIALNCLVATKTKSPEELIRVATKNLKSTQQKLLAEAQGKQNGNDTEN